MNLQQQPNIQSVIYNTTQDKWYVFFFENPEPTRDLIPQTTPNAYQYITTDETEAEMWLRRFYLQWTTFGLEIDQTNAHSSPASWKGEQFFGVVQNKVMTITGSTVFGFKPDGQFDEAGNFVASPTGAVYTVLTHVVGTDFDITSDIDFVMHDSTHVNPDVNFGDAGIQDIQNNWICWADEQSDMAGYDQLQMFADDGITRILVWTLNFSDIAKIDNNGGAFAYDSGTGELTFSGNIFKFFVTGTDTPQFQIEPMFAQGADVDATGAVVLGDDSVVILPNPQTTSHGAITASATMTDPVTASNYIFAVFDIQLLDSHTGDVSGLFNIDGFLSGNLIAQAPAEID